MLLFVISSATTVIGRLIYFAQTTKFLPFLAPSSSSLKLLPLSHVLANDVAAGCATGNNAMTMTVTVTVWQWQVAVWQRSNRDISQASAPTFLSQGLKMTLSL
jgi:hypothetical protein